MSQKELQQAFQKLGRRDVDTFPASVVSVDKNRGTCVAETDGIQYEDVQLSATIDDSDNNDKRFLLFPKIGSFVLLSPINEDIHRLYVEFFSEVDELKVKLEGSEFSFNDDGFLLKKQNETLKQLMTDLLKGIQNMKFTTNTGSTIALVNKPTFIAIENRFKNFLKDN